MASQSAASGAVVLPKGGGALHGIGEKFAPDLYTGTGNFTVPIALPPGRRSFQPELSLVYSTGQGNGPFGLGWGVSIPGIARRTSRGVPRYDDTQDTFILSGAEDLVPVAAGPAPGVVAYRPRTEGLFALVAHHRAVADDYWEVRGKDGLVSRYGHAGAAGVDPAAVADPSRRTKVFAWRLTETRDPFDNRITYDYRRDTGRDGSHFWDQLYLAQIGYAEVTERGITRPLVTVGFDYDEARPDPFSEYRAGFEIRTRWRCRQIRIRTHADADRLVRTYRLTYLNERPELAGPRPPNGVSLLSQVTVTGHDGDRVEELPPLEFGYTRFDPQTRKFFAVQGSELPARSLADASLALVDLFGHGLPDILELNGTARYWRNLGGGRFDRARAMPDAPAGLALADPGVQLIDADGDGRTDLLVTTGTLGGYFPLRFGGEWDRRSFRPYSAAPSFDLEDPEVRLLDLNGDGVTDAIRAGSRLECFFNDPREGWARTRWVERRALEDFPDVGFSDPRVKWADLTGDGLQDLVLVSDGNVEYWPNLGHGDWGRRVHMAESPRFPHGYDPRRILLGDVDGDGLADLVYVDDTRVTLWVNQGGTRWSAPLVIRGTPRVTDMDAVRLVDLLGSGIGGVLWSADADGLSREYMFFLDFTGGTKPYLLNEMDNHTGAVTRVAYAPSTRFYLEDQPRPATRWKTPLPFPVQVVARVEVIDELSGGKLTTEYRYHHGYWDGVEREFRGFGRVDQRDSEQFADYAGAGLSPQRSFAAVGLRAFSAPTETRTWFHQGPIGDGLADEEATDFSSEFWPEDPPGPDDGAVAGFLRALPRRARRDALRALRGRVLRTELYALDATPRRERPYTVTEHAYGLREESPPGAADGARPRIFFPHRRVQRTRQWERGDDPLTRYTLTDAYDAVGQPRQQTTVAMPRRAARRGAADEVRVLATHTRTEYAQPDAGLYLHDRVAHARTFELRQPGGVAEAAPHDLARVLLEHADAARAVHQRFRDLLDPWRPGQALPAPVRLIGHTIHHYDGAPGQAFVGRPVGEVGPYGALTRSEALAFTDDELDAAYGFGRPAYLGGNGALPAGAPAGFGAALGYRLEPDAATGYHRGYYADTLRRRFDFHAVAVAQVRGVVLGSQDPLQHENAIVLDPYGLLPAELRDPAGLVTRVAYDYRVLQPREVTDPNGTRTRYAFTPLGLLDAVSVTGDPGDGDLARPGLRLGYGFRAFVDSPPGARQPIFVRTVRQVHHDTEADVPLPERDATLETVEYSDGFGRLLQTRTQAEDVRFGDPHFGGGALPAAQADGAGGDLAGVVNAERLAPNVVVSGWQTYDNKGRVVERYEPFFATGWAYAPPRAEQLGRRATLRYDPLGRLSGTVLPDGSQQRMIHGVPPALDDPDTVAPTPWETYAYDANDNAGRTHPALAAAYRHHWDTPTSRRTDALGRTVEAVEHNRGPSDPGQPLAPLEAYRTRSSYDVQDNLLRVTDPLGRVVLRQAWDLRQRVLRAESVDSGTRLAVFDAVGNPVEQRDQRGAVLLRGYDALNRQARLWARDGAGQPFTLRERIEYGDAGDPNQPPAERAAQRAARRLGRPHRQYDEAGLLTFERYDFKGNARERVRRVIADAEILGVFAAGVDQVDAYRVNWEPPVGVTLEGLAAARLDAAEYRVSLTHDALNRIRTLTCPQDVDGGRRLLRPRYNRAGAIERVELGGDVYVGHIAYDAKGQRLLIAYGNGVMTRSAYDPDTFRLARMRTERFQAPGPNAYHPVGAPLQDCAYARDLTGHILAAVERVPGCGFVNNPDAMGLPAGDPLAPLLAAGDALVRRFAYDPLYRLVSATGREAAAIPGPRPWTDDPRQGFNAANHGTPDQGNAPNLTTGYAERYAYDAAGNLVTLQHAAQGQPAWTRHCGMGGLTPQQWRQEWEARWNAGGPWPNPPGNRLTHVGDDAPNTPETHRFDANGNLIRQNVDRHFEWDHSDRLRVARTQPPAAPPSRHAHYLYDAAGRRVKKLVWRGAGTYDATVYVDGVFEHHRRVRPADVREHDTLHVMDDRSRIATVRVGNAFPDDGAPEARVQYHLGDHLGSSQVVIGGADAAAQAFINREEYLPYGETAFGSFARKRYRFAGSERDDESGLSYQGARYYAAWLGRWVSCDPLGLAGGPNPYVAFADDPVNTRDPTGTQPEVPPDSVFKERDAPRPETRPQERGQFAQEERELKEQAQHPVRVTTPSGRPVFEPNIVEFKPTSTRGMVVLGPVSPVDRLREALDRLKPTPVEPPTGLESRGQRKEDPVDDPRPLKTPHLREFVQRVLVEVSARIVTRKDVEARTAEATKKSTDYGGGWRRIRRVIGRVREDVPTGEITQATVHYAWPSETDEIVELKHVVKPYDRDPGSLWQYLWPEGPPSPEEARRLMQHPQRIRVP